MRYIDVADDGTMVAMKEMTIFGSGFEYTAVQALQLSIQLGLIKPIVVGCRIGREREKAHVEVLENRHGRF